MKNKKKGIIKMDSIFEGIAPELAKEIKTPLATLPPTEVEVIDATPKPTMGALIEVTEKSIVLAQKPIIQFDDFDSFKAQVKETLKKYEGLVVKEGDIISTKHIIAQFNKDSKILNDARIVVKKELLSGYSILDTQVKEIDALWAKGTKHLGDQVNAFILKEKEAKKEEINKLFNAIQTEYPKVTFLKLKEVYSEKWLNKTVKIDYIEADIISTFDKCNADIELINMEPVIGGRLKHEYVNNGFKLAEAKAVILQQIAEEKEAQAQIDARMEAEKMVAPTPEKVATIQHETKIEIETQKAMEPKIVSTALISVSFKVTGTVDNLRLIKPFFKENGLEWEAL